MSLTNHREMLQAVVEDRLAEFGTVIVAQVLLFEDLHRLPSLNQLLKAHAVLLTEHILQLEKEHPHD